ncbi:hypothetical protein DTO164E3_3048 [Paecilomyces variotii]|nr:hypothetical protein DTO032I3_4647 [Paecilomyces variotii]KAJ9202608.1 hypothetical protein DTO164E3_3048 [Paecilomyces variotii]KAJ9283066.1 hypothetical protein DTO021D3_403 [Paecilomyces variotii]KAJ9322538.1 hypothetical protein DTO027B3_6496 [Paecilomyces variotii]KAJ9331284.1 hypothetical protein DTO027B5_6974 [Paecilomyces variotii]
MHPRRIPFHFHISMLLLFLISLFSIISNAKSKGDVTSSPSPNRSNYDLDLVDFLHVKTSEHDNVFKGAIQLLESMQSSPSCNRIAASKLLASCKSIEKSASNERQPTLTSLDRVKSVYAARLALCEIAEAGAAIPSSCSPLYISSSPKKAVSGSIFGQQWATPDQLNPSSMESLDLCLHALESRPQWWTSYSNSRQNAVMICQAARFDIEKEEVLELHRRITENTLRLNNGLQDAIQNAAAMSAQHRAFILATESMQRDLLRDIEEAGASTLSIFPRLINGIEAAVGSTITRIISSLGGVEKDTANLQKDVRDTTQQVSHLRDGLRVTYEEAIAKSAQLARSHQMNAESNQELAVSIQTSLKSLLTEDVVKLSESLEGFGGSMQWLTEALSLIYQQEELILERLQNFQESLAESEIKSENLRKSQELQAESLKDQTKAQETLGENVRIAQALLDRVVTTAANLQATVEETATGFQGLPSFPGMVGVYFPWTLCSLLASVVAAQHPRIIAGLLFLSCGKYNPTSLSQKTGLTIQAGAFYIFRFIN